MKYFSAFLKRIAALVKLSVIKVKNYNYFRFEPIEIVSQSTKFIFQKKGRIKLGGHIGTRKNVEFRVNGGTLEVGEGCFFNNNCMIVSHDKISIGNNCSFGPNVMLFDHDHDFRVSGGKKKGEYRTSPIIIGSNVWIGANTVILRGTSIGDNCIIGAGGVIKGNYSENSIVVQKRITTISEYKIK